MSSYGRSGQKCLLTWKKGEEMPSGEAAQRNNRGSRPYEK